MIRPSRDKKTRPSFSRKMNISSVVNCTTDIKNHHEGVLKYFTFDIAWWKRRIVGDDQDQAIVDFLLPLMDFLEDRMKRGENVLVHCLAGAHRAGTTAILCLMHFAGLDAKKATSTARSLRSIIDPIGDLRQLLTKCDNISRSSDGRFSR